MLLLLNSASIRVIIGGIRALMKIYKRHNADAVRGKLYLTAFDAVHLTRDLGCTIIIIIGQDIFRIFASCSTISITSDIEFKNKSRWIAFGIPRVRSALL